MKYERKVKIPVDVSIGIDTSSLLTFTGDFTIKHSFNVESLDWDRINETFNSKLIVEIDMTDTSSKEAKIKFKKTIFIESAELGERLNDNSICEGIGLENIIETSLSNSELNSINDRVSGEFCQVFVFIEYDF